MSDQLYFETAPYEELCGCVSVSLTESEQRALNFAETTGKRDAFMKRKFSLGRQRNYLADCPNCDTGIRLKKGGC